ncbi:MAG: crotonase/enoyl-CoA hydratase family protein [Gammaproteobacteria bacterium]
MNDRVRLDVDGNIARVCLTRAEKRNALDLSMFESIVAAAAEISAREDIRAVVMHGAGPAFCAGLDLAAFFSDPNAGARLLGRQDNEDTNLAQEAAWCWRRLPVPVIAALHGETFGGGLQIALGADIRLIAPDTRMSVMEIRWGLVPDMAGSRILPELLRLDVFKELTFSGRIVEASEAVSLGLATRVCDDPLASAISLAEEIAARSPDAVRAAKFLLDQASQCDHPSGLALETRLQMSLLGGRNQMEAARAGMEKREPLFREATFDPERMRGQRENEED